MVARHSAKPDCSYSITVNDNISRLQDAICRLTGCTSKYVETVAVTERFHGFRGEVRWQREVAVFEIEDHSKATRVYASVNKNPDRESATHVIVLAIPPVNSARAAMAAAMAASIVNGSL